MVRDGGKWCYTLVVAAPVYSLWIWPSPSVPGPTARYRVRDGKCFAVSLVRCVLDGEVIGSLSRYTHGTEPVGGGLWVGSSFMALRTEVRTVLFLPPPPIALTRLSAQVLDKAPEMDTGSVKVRGRRQAKCWLWYPATPPRLVPCQVNCSHSGGVAV